MKINNTKSSRLILLLAGILFLGVVGFAGMKIFGKTSEQIAESSEPKDTLRVQAGWLLNGEFASICSAIVNGYYDQQNLEVELIPGGPSGASFIVATTAIVQDPSLDIAVDSDLVPLLKGVTQENEANRMKAKAFAALWNEIPFGFIVREDSGINSLKDLSGRKENGEKYKIGVTADFVLQEVMAEHAGVEVDDLDFVTVGFDATPFLAGQVDALAAFWVTQAYEVEKAGIPYRFLNISELTGFSQPSMVAIATDKTLNKKREQLVRWVKATQEGIEFVKTKPHEAAEHILDSRCGGSAFNLEQENWLINKSLPLYEQPVAGKLNTEQIGNFADAFSQAGQIPFTPEPSTYLDTSIVQ